MAAPHRSATATVNLLRLRSATPELPMLDVAPPPNMSDRPPPRPLWSRISTVRNRLVSTRRTWRVMRIAVTTSSAVRGAGVHGALGARSWPQPKRCLAMPGPVPPTFVARSGSAVPASPRFAGRGRPNWGRRSGGHVLAVADDGGELCHVDRGPPDQRSVDV